MLHLQQLLFHALDGRRHRRIRRLHVPNELARTRFRREVPQFLGRDSQQEGGIAGQADGGVENVRADADALPCVKLPVVLLSLDGQFTAEDINQLQRLMPVHRDVAARNFCVLVTGMTGNVQPDVLVIHAGASFLAKCRFSSA